MEKDEQEKDASADSKSNKRSEIRNVIYTIKPVLVCENWFGIFRFSVVNNVLVKTNRKIKVLGFLITSIYLAIFSGVIRIPKEITGTGSLMEALDELPSLIILFQYVTSVITTSFFIWKPTNRIFSTFAKLDTQLCISMNKDFYKHSRKQSVKFLILLFTTHIAFSIFDHMTDDEFLAFKFIDLILYIQQDIEICVFCKMVFMLKNRLDVVNDYLRKFVMEQENSSSIFTVSKKDAVSDKKLNFIGRSSMNNTKIRDLAAIYDHIGETCLSINEVFNFQMFMNLVSTFSYTVLTIWTALYYFRKPEYPSGQMLTVVIWCILTVLSVAVMSFSCESLLSSRRNTKILVNEIIMDYDLPKPMRVQAKVFMELIEAWPLRIFVYDMFSVDLTLMLKFISVATTYLIVLIQVSHFV